MISLYMELLNMISLIFVELREQASDNLTGHPTAGVWMF